MHEAEIIITDNTPKAKVKGMKFVEITPAATATFTITRNIVIKEQIDSFGIYIERTTPSHGIYSPIMSSYTRNDATHNVNELMLSFGRTQGVNKTRALTV